MDQNKNSLAASIAGALNIAGGIWSHDEPEGDAIAPNEQVQCALDAATTGTDNSPASAVLVKSEFLASGLPAPTSVVGGAWHQLSNGRGSRTVEASVISAVIMLRSAMSAAVEHERGRLVMAGNEVAKPSSIIRRRLAEERDRLRCIDQKLIEKSGTHDRAAKQYQRARDMINAAQFEITAATPLNQKRARNSFSNNFEDLVEGWIQDVAVAYAQLESWELKKIKQNERVATLTAELKAADELQKSKQAILDKSLKNLQALEAWLATL